VVAKSIGSQNPYNMIRATIDGLKQETSPRMVAQRRGKKVADILRKKPEAESRGGEGWRRKPSSCSRWLAARRPAVQTATLKGLGLNKMRRTRELEDTPRSAAW
jgi:hypothetical protein